MEIREIAEAIRKYDDYVITSHIETEGDAIGTELAIFHLVKQLGKRAIVVNNDTVPDRYKFLAGWDKIIIDIGGKIKNCKHIIVVDCPTIERSGRVAQLINEADVIINIDHHVSNENFGSFNWVEPDTSSCGEMVFKLYNKLGLHINELIAEMLYVAILTDTGSFRYDSTTPETHQIAGELIKLGVRPAKVSEKVFETKQLNDIGLLSRALSTLNLTNDGKIAYMCVTKKMLEETHTTSDRTDGFINFARSIEGSEISILFREDIDDQQKVHVGFRSKGEVNANVLASRFGGGGHPKASGCLISGNLNDVMKEVLKSAEEFLL